MKKAIVLTILVFIFLFFDRCVNHANPVTGFSYVGSGNVSPVTRKNLTSSNYPIIIMRWTVPCRLL
jgi:hypothetical protein